MLGTSLSSSSSQYQHFIRFLLLLLLLFKSFSSSFSPINMKILTLASTLLLAGSAVAAPNTAKRFAGHAKRAANSRIQGKPINRVSSGPEAESSNKTFVEYSSNWAGAVLIGSGYKSVTGTFTVPTPSTTGSGAAGWVLTATLAGQRFCKLVLTGRSPGALSPTMPGMNGIPITRTTSLASRSQPEIPSKSQSQHPA